jgi:hypothetical protein
MPIRDTRLLARAVMQRWPINPKMREGIIGALARVLTDPNASHREKTSAAKALMAAEKQNQEDEHKVIDVSIQARNDRLDEIAADLGIEVSAIEDATRKAGTSNRGDEVAADQ